ncbi:MAG: hypothetical protein R2719_09645 [Micropruina sp.]
MAAPADALQSAPRACTTSSIEPSVKAAARAGAGTNNILVAEYSKAGIPVFTPPSPTR